MNPQEKFYVYTYSYPDGTPFYVGKGCGKRWKQHRYNAGAGKNKNQFNVRVISKLLRESKEPIIKKITENVDSEFAGLVEQEFITKYGRRDLGRGPLTNLTDGGDGVAALSEEAEERRRKGLRETENATRFKKGHKPFNAGTVGLMKAWNKGFFSSQATKAKISASVTEQMKDPKRREIVSRTMLGRKYRLGIKHTPETIEKIRAAKRGVPSTKKGKPVSETARINIAASARGFMWVCPHCAISGCGKGAANQWHFEKCREKGV